MPYDFKAAIRFRLRLDDLDVDAIAKARDDFRAILDAVLGNVKIEGRVDFDIETDNPKIVGVRAKEPEAPAPMINLPAAGAPTMPAPLANDLLSKSGPVPNLVDDLEIPEPLRRK